MTTQPEVIAYTDGGCRGNPGVGGWGFLLIDTKTGTALERRGGAANTTNNRMEMTAAIEALGALTKPDQQIEIRTDSRYLRDMAESWLPGWKRRGWQRQGEEPIKNLDLVKLLDERLSRHHVTWRWVKGHSGEPGNEHVDGLTNDAMDDIARGADGAGEHRHAVSPVAIGSVGGK